MGESSTFKFSELNPVCIIRRLLCELPSIIAAGLIAVLLTLTGVQIFYEPVYTANATVAVNMKNAGFASVYSNLTATSEIAGTFTELFESQTFAVLAQEKLGGDKLVGELKAEVLPQTNLIELSVTTDNPADAFKTLRFLIDNYDIISEHVFQNVMLRVLDDPTMPTAPSNPLNRREAAKKAFIAGSAVMVLALIAVAVLLDTVQTDEGMERRVDARLFATIHHERQNRTLRSWFKHRDSGNLLITMPKAGFFFTEEFGKLASKVIRASEKNERKVLLITSVAENEGKSTVAANMALALAHDGKKVLLIDADLHKPSQADLFGVKPEYELAEIIVDSDKYQMQQLGREKVWGMFSTLEQPGASELLTSTGMRQIIEKARREMDIVIIDTPPMAVFSDAEAIADFADISLIVVRQDRVSAGRINDAVDVLEQCRADFEGCIFNDVRSFDLPGSGHTYGYGYGYNYGYGNNRKRAEEKNG